MAQIIANHYFDLSGGQQNRTTKYFKANNESELVFNGRFSRLGGIQKRNGYTQLGSDIGTGTAILGVGPYNYGGSNERLAVASGTDVYLWNGSTYSAQSLSLSSPTAVEFETFFGPSFYG